MDKFGILIIAGGSSSRLGYPKQLVRYKNQALINHISDEAQQSNLGEVLIVLGAHADTIAPQLTLPNYIVNEFWSNGMGSSIACGVKHFETTKNKQGLFIILCDQYLLTAMDLIALNKIKLETKKGIITSTYNNIYGAPAFFDKKYFILLSELSNDKGAKFIIQNNLADIAEYYFPNGQYDLDTTDDHQQIKNQQ